MRKRSLCHTNWMLVVFVLVALALSACGPRTLVVGIQPTPTATPLPTPVVRSYANDEYGFTFRYPEAWTLAEGPHVVQLSRGTLVLSIGHGWASSPGFSPMGGRTGMPAGDFIYGGKVFFLDQVIPAQVLEYERKDKMVLYGETSLVEVGDLVFSMWLEDVVSANYDELDIPKDLQAEAKEILESFELIEATGKPPAPAPTPAPVGDKDLITYVNDDYRLAFIYPSDWELEEVPGGESATTVELTKGTLRLAIQFKGAEEATVLGPSGRPAGEIEERGTVTILGREVPKQVLVFEGKDKSVFLGDRFEDLELYAQLDDGVGAQVAYEAIEIPESAQSAMDAILGSLTHTGEQTSLGQETLTYENAAYGFSFEYPATWTVEEVVGEAIEDGVKLADAVILSQGTFKIVLQYQRESDPAQVGWDGRLMPGDMRFEEAVLGDKVTVMGVETHKRIWTYNDGLKAVFVGVVADAADLVFNITLGDSSVMSITDVEAQSVPEPAMAALDQVLRSLGETR